MVIFFGLYKVGNIISVLLSEFPGDCLNGIQLHMAGTWKDDHHYKLYDMGSLQLLSTFLCIVLVII